MSRASRSALVLGALVLFGPSLIALARPWPSRLRARRDVARDSAPQAIPAPFESDSDVGDVKLPGATVFDQGRGEIRLTASGLNLWGAVDAFRFLSRRVTGDVDLSAAISFVGEGRNPHRKAGLMVRASLAPDAPYAHAVVHGDGLVSLQYRETPGRRDERAEGEPEDGAGGPPALAARGRLHDARERAGHAATAGRLDPARAAGSGPRGSHGLLTRGGLARDRGLRRRRGQPLP